MASELVSLASQILESAKIIDERCKTLSTEFPRLDEPFDPKSMSIYLQPDIASATSLLLSATSQITATVKPPTHSILDCANCFLLSAALRSVSLAGVADVLAKTKEGVSIDDISKQTGIEPTKLARIMRPLSTHHIFREISPNIFVHNRLSSILTSGRSVQMIRKQPQDKYKGEPGIFSIVEWLTDEVFKGAAYLAESLLDPETAQSNLPTQSAFNKAFAVDADVFEWYEAPDNALRFQRFSMAMSATRALSPPDTILKGFQWSSLPINSHVVDVGGGTGSLAFILCKNFDMRVTVQDRAAVLDQAKKDWNSNCPEGPMKGSIDFQEHDFFAEQPLTDVAVFILRYILHDWSDEYAVKILKNLRKAASATTALIAIDFLLPEMHPTEAKGSILKFDAPLARTYLADLMTAVFNGRERTQAGITSLMKEAGWVVNDIYTPPGSLERHIVAKPGSY